MKQESVAPQGASAGLNRARTAIISVSADSENEVSHDVWTVRHEQGRIYLSAHLRLRVQVVNW